VIDRIAVGHDGCGALDLARGHAHDRRARWIFAIVG
jgi:hypothetical protein